MTAPARNWPVAVATHAARDAIGPVPGPGFASFLDWAAKAGFDGIDFSDSVLPFDAPCEGLDAVAHAVAERGLTVAALNLLRAGLADDDHAAESMERARWSIRAAAALGASVVSLSLALPRQVDDCNRYRGLDHSRGGSRDAPDRDVEATAGRLRDLATDAAREGVALSIETHHASLADTGAATLRLWRMVGSDRLGVNPDLVNVYWAYATPEEDWRDTLRLLAPHANLWHVKNVRRVEVEPGRRAKYLGTRLDDGDVDHRWAVARMREAGFDGWMSVERGGGGDALAQLRAGLAYLRDDLFRDDTPQRES